MDEEAHAIQQVVDNEKRDHKYVEHTKKGGKKDKKKKKKKKVKGKHGIEISVSLGTGSGSESHSEYSGSGSNPYGSHRSYNDRAGSANGHHDHEQDHEPHYEMDDPGE